MEKKKIIFPAFVHKGKKTFGVSFPDFPGCVTAHENLEDARKMASEALELHLEGMLEDGEKIPDPSRKIKINESIKDGLIAIVEIEAVVDLQ
jgi:predicted RNase H-like HicB family nuclease